MTAEMHLPLFFVRQKFAMTVNRYSVHAADPDGRPGQLMGVADQKRLALREQVTFFADESRTRPVFGFKARQRLDLNAGYDITDETGGRLGYFRKDFGASLLRTTFHLEGPGYAGTGQERNPWIAVVRRVTDVPFLPIHFDFVDPAGAPLLSVERQATVRDFYTVRVPDRRVDFRVAAAVAVAMDALMSR